MSEQNAVPDLYQLAFMPGCFRCPQCGFVWSISTINVASGTIGTTEENRQTPDCPNDGTRMVNVTYREQLEVYADRLKEELEERDRLKAEISSLRGALKEAPHAETCLSRFCAKCFAPISSHFPHSLHAILSPKPNGRKIF